LSVFASVIGGLVLFFSMGMGLKNATEKPVDISKLPDGTYTGELTGSRFSNKLEAKVSTGRIIDIMILSDMVIVAPNVSTQIFAKVLEEQSLQVDCISQATVSSKASSRRKTRLKTIS